MTDTPETDSWCGWGVGGLEVVPSSCARKLERERDTAIAELDVWKAKFIQQNKDLGCEMMDPNGTIWDYAKKLQKDLDAAIAERDELRRTNEGLQLTFDLRWKADQRAIKRWQDATGKKLTWPDHADLVVWLLENYCNKSNQPPNQNE